MKNHIVSNWAAWLLTVSGMAALPLTASATVTEISGTRIAVTVNDSATRADVTYDTDGATANYAPITVSGTSTFTGTRVTVVGAGAIAYAQRGANLTTNSTLNLTDSTISSMLYGIVATGTSFINLNNTNITSASSYGVSLNTSMLTMTGGTVAGRYGVYLTGGASSGTLNNVTIETTGNTAVGVYLTGSGDMVARLNQVRITTSGIDMAGYGIRVAGEGYNSLELHDSSVTVKGLDTAAIFFSPSSNVTGQAQAIIDHSVIISEHGHGLVFGNDTDRVKNWAAIPDFANTYGSYDVTISNGTVISAGPGHDAIHVNSFLSGTLTNGDPTIYTGEYHVLTNIHVDHVEIADRVAVLCSATANIDFKNDAQLNGDLITDGVAEANVSFDNSTMTGNLTGSGTAILDITFSGSNSALLGDIAQHDHAVVTVTLSDGATGEGGFVGGNLITGSDSAWTFDKDSHGNYGENNGTWNIGDYEVIFDNMIHTGTITISVNSDTGEGGSITVTDTADGEGTVHIDATGDGKADPNKVLPGIVKGEGTDDWQWDPIDWGIDQLIKDGDHFVKNGTSPAGAVLNSAIAVQQSLWFAQQNSLLKRMGELRYGARASRPLADKDVRVPYHSLIENIWIRSYGQQLNVGSQVAGKAYEQLIYGVDLGTDHKFTLSADSDLYLGVYAGYGRSDLDYRTPGADGEINSYYGGLYATWLHSSGFYIDATFKAASVNNDLKAPYGTTQLKASYSDVNLGGSIELGKKFTFTDDWFIEPQFQVNYLHILAENYTAGPMTISAQDLDALQLRIGSLFGRTIKLANGGALQPYIKISGVETISSGGTLRNGYQHTRANTDGARAELGGGLIWQLDADNQLHLDYEASFGDKYDKPWGLTAGYRHQF
ncbi:MAG: autotransporter outer membrane beta-barrel domain-containing protein [Verrucomicrobiales bacterium]|nr:autotransporter outer membrane beta-barrel domain-containing protein [Verrucomicrobiales bacterium]